MSCRSVLLICLTLALCGGGIAGSPEWSYIENGKLRLGFRRDAGACIGFLAAADGKNVLDSFDHGRFIQQSYYGDKDGSDWNGKPWRYNPVQGGDWKGHPATILELKVEKSSLYSKVRPRQWASGADVPEMEMEQWATLNDDVLHLRVRMTYRGEKTHGVIHHEIPAIFLAPQYDTLVVKEGAEERRWKPGWPNEGVKMPEHWALWLDSSGTGLGIYVPSANSGTCYRYMDGKGPSACSYIAPLAKFGLTPGQVFEYEAWFTIGPESALRARIEALRRTVEAKR